jgi:hypothetical protein
VVTRRHKRRARTRRCLSAVQHTLCAFVGMTCARAAVSRSALGGRIHARAQPRRRRAAALRRLSLRRRARLDASACGSNASALASRQPRFQCGANGQGFVCRPLRNTLPP